jgi:hypothetical protein|tara:strand:- start:1808 stop:2344 length:537 start_codon:yes stop_codon:yes gene_type:complete
MKLFSIPFLALLVVISTSCSSNLGTKVNEPFSGKSYLSNARYFKATGKGVSHNENVATSKATMESHKALAQMVSTSIQVVADNYLEETQGEHVDMAVDVFKSLTRQITNTTIADLRQTGSKKFLQDDGKYAVYVAYEIKKAAMFRFLKKIAKLNPQVSPLVRSQIINMCDEELLRLED